MRFAPTLAPRAARRWLCAALAAVVVLAQLATSAYACPGSPMAPAAASDTASAMAGMPCADAEGGAMTLDAEQPALCLQHCQFGSTQQPAEQPLPTLATTSAPALLFLLMPLLAAAGDPRAWRAHARRREHVPRPTHCLLHCCLRL